MLHSSFSKSDHATYNWQKTYRKFNKILSYNYLLKVNNRNSRTRYEKCSKVTIKTSDGSTLWTYFTSWFCVFIIEFEQLIRAVSGFFEALLSLILNRYFVKLVIGFLNYWVLTGKCRLLGKLEETFHNCRKLLSIGVNIQNVFLGECLPD